MSGSATNTTTSPPGPASCALSRSHPTPRTELSALYRRARADPPEEWDGPWEFLARTQPHLVFAAMLRSADIVGHFLDADEDAIVADVLGEHHDELAALMPLLGLERFDRRACNKALAASATSGKESEVLNLVCR